MKALVKDNVVIELCENEFEIHPSFIFMDAPQGCQPGWVLIDGVLQEKPVVPKTNDEIKKEYTEAIKYWLGVVAAEKQYDSEQSISNYIASTNVAWQLEAQTYIAWRDAVWAYAYTEFAKFENNARPLVSVDAFLQELPVIVWP